MYQLLKYHIHTFYKHWSFIWKCVFHVCIFKHLLLTYVFRNQPLVLFAPLILIISFVTYKEFNQVLFFQCITTWRYITPWSLFESMCSRMDQVKFVEDSLSNIWSYMVCLSQNLLCPFLNTLTHLFRNTICSSQCQAIREYLLKLNNTTFLYLVNLLRKFTSLKGLMLMVLNK